MTDIIEVLENGIEVIEVIEQGPAGASGIAGQPFKELGIGTKDTILLTQHDGTVNTETVVNFGTFSNADIDMTDGVITLLVDLDHMFYDLIFDTSVSGAGNSKTATLNSWLESSLDSGTTWTVVDDTLVTVTLTEKSEGNVNISMHPETNKLAQTMFRSVVAKTGDTSIDISFLSDTLITSKGPVTSNSAEAIMLYKTL